MMRTTYAPQGLALFNIIGFVSGLSLAACSSFKKHKLGRGVFSAKGITASSERGFK